MGSTSVFCENCGSVALVETPSAGEAPCSSCGTALQVPGSCEVFISYSTANLDNAKQVAAGIKSAGINCWLAPDRIELGESFWGAIDDALASAKVVVLILSSTSVQSPWVLREITEAISSRLAVLPLRVEDFEIPREWRRLLSHNQYEDTFHQPFETYIEGLVSRVQEELLKAAARAALPLQTAAKSAPAPVPETAPLLGVDPAISPYLGPRPFTAMQANNFFGRQREAEALLQRIGESRMTLVYAPSGAGKSSLLNTLIYQALDDQGFDVLLGARVGGVPSANVKASDIRNIYSFSTVSSLDKAVTPNPQCRVDSFLKSIGRKPDTQGRVLILDQFEELFTCHPGQFESRRPFFDELIAALQDDPRLRIVLAMRQEYLADLEQLVVQLPAELSFQRFSLRRMGPEAALEAITRPAAPYAGFEPGVAEDIVCQLNTIRAVRFDGVVESKRGEFIEMVHLQIVCQRLWSSLPKGITSITKEHVERAAGEGKTFNEFVVNALDAFYEDTIAQVAESAATHLHGQYSKELIQLGCMKFVTTSSTRTMVPLSHGRAGRLPDWIVQQLADSHLLRFEDRGGVQWYELSHDRLAEPVARQMDRKVTALLFASDLLDKVLEKVLADCGGQLKGYFEEHREILRECEPFHNQVGLFADEAEFLFRSSLVDGQDLQAWSKRLAADYPEIRLAVLREALASGPVAVRQHAAWLLGKEATAELSSELVRLVLSDDDEGVRRTAACSLVQLNQPVLFTAVTDALKNPQTKNAAIRAFSYLRAMADQRAHAEAFVGCYRELSASLRREVRERAWWLRFCDAQAVLPYIFAPAAVFAGIAAAAFKWLPGAFNLALCQATPSAGMGIFHGLTAGMIWGGFIPIGLVLHQVVFSNARGKQSFLKPFGALLFGAVFGAVSGLLLTIIIVSVFTPASLKTMGWVVTSTPFTREFWRELFFQTLFGWSYVITGTGLGVGLALMTNGLQASGDWAAFLGKQGRLTSLKQTVGVVKNIVSLAWRYAWPIPIALLITGALAVRTQRPPASAFREKASADKVSLVGRTLGTGADCATQAIGGFFSVVGLGVGLIIMRYGLQLQPREEQD